MRSPAGAPLDAQSNRPPSKFRTGLHPPDPRPQPVACPMTTDLTASEPTERTIYDRAFWLAYAANLMLVTANSLTFRFAEFIHFLGGSETVTGQIVRAGLLGSLAVRLVLGQAIDGAGVRRIWTASTVCFVAGGLMFVFSDRIGPQLYVARVLFTAGMASMFACSIYHVQSQVPPYRRTEVIGSLGTSGFIGMIAGTQFGDLLFHTIPNHGRLFAILFGITVGLGIGYFVLIARVTRGEAQSPVSSPPIHRLAFRYWPGAVVLVALVMGAGFTVTTVFLTRYATEHGLHGIGMFFVGYAACAFVFRWVSRSWSAAIGRHRVILIGLAGHVIGYLLLIPVRSDLGFLLPAVLHGFGHALLFPCVVSLGAGAFPPEYRGTGTTIILAFVDLGTMLSAPLLGRLIEADGFTYTYLAMAALTFAVAAVYAALKFRVADFDGLPAIAHDETLVDDLPEELATVPAPSVTPSLDIDSHAAESTPVTCRRA
ncbi:MAG: MFS transporter [Planctomycetaceae bacterium]